MADLISKQQVCEVLAQFAPENYTQLVEMLVVKLPAVDAVPVVRCKDCEWGEKCEVESLLREVDKIPDPYCAAGKRREENAAD